jgi:hypothetical protein
MNLKRILVLGAFTALAARADEGMWTYDNFPAAKVAKKYGFAPDAKWLEEARLASVRLAGGCSASFVSREGLVMTNHHCAHRCIEHLSTKEKDFVKDGFYAPALENEARCPEIELNELVQITDVTARINAATKGLSGQAYNERQKAEMSAVEKECAGDDEKVRCDVVTLYHGGIYDLYRYKRFQDVRLVFAPEFAIAFFGGDPDNFNFPRYDLDVTFLRAYENDKPARTEHFFKWSPDGAREGDLTFVSGHPGGTDRELTMAELQYQRDVALPERIFDLAEYRGAIAEFGKISPEHYRISEAELFGVENSYKAMKGRYEALISREVWDPKREREKSLRAKVDSKPRMKREYGAGWGMIAKALAEYRPRRKEYRYVEGGDGFKSRLFNIARTLLRGTEELRKPNEKRLREYRDSALPSLKQALFSRAPIYDELEVFRLTYGLTKLREELGADHPFVHKVLGKKSPDELARELVAGSKLKDVQLRRQLWQDGKGKEAVLASTDSMIELARFIDPDARALRKWHDDEIESAEKRGAEMIAKAKFELQGTSNYPDATFTLRLSYGSVQGWDEPDHHVDPLTHMAGAFERATGRDPFKLPQSWLRANEQKQINLSTPLDFCSTNDIIGGNSGSPVFDKDRQIVGLIFDGNIHSLGGDYYYDEKLNRAVAVHSAALLEALDHIYGARRIVGELKGAPSGSGGP